ncbi:multidrug efflux MFS transporter [Rhodococcus fascians]|nr:multidrug efflux MFS transporter [Rhodococcus fascians]MBY4140911.1 multidrug efflux MFS transporter [Rhodococcus fascians]MBY4219575.1 multidrug efflux MFS transporter [Rhodococcus fascians]MBY4221884.1 multidrug efflux MFS transporter [Rhodococcus fascians]MBY4233885.1 multidrug efflux MFS transporter [Rhodococcus fascians]
MHTGQTHDAPASTSQIETTAGGRLLIAVLLVATFVVILNETILSVALPRLMSDLSIAASSAQWLTSGFLLTMAIVIPVSGYILQRFAIRPIFVIAMSLFSSGTLLSALAPGFEVLLAGRVVQAMGTGLMFPLLITTVLNVVPAHARGRMMGMISVVISVAPALGPTISGLVLQALSWRAMFWLVLPISLTALVLGAILVRNVTEPRPAYLDLPSVVLSALAFGGLVYGLTLIGEAAGGHAPITPAVPITVGLISLVTFVLRQRILVRTDRALLDLRPFGRLPFSIAVALLCVIMLTLFGSLILLPLYMQNVLGEDTLTTGLALLPGGIVMGLLAPIVGNLFDRFGPRGLVLPGTLALTAGMWILATLGVESSLRTVIAGHVILSCGIAFALTPLMTTSLGSLPRELYSHGSAIVSTLQQLAGAAGTALFITMMARGIRTADAEGSEVVVANADGIHSALVIGGFISLLAVAGSLALMKIRLEKSERRITTSSQILE